VSGGIHADPKYPWYWVDRKGATEQFEDFSMKPIAGLRISPDGKKIAYMMPDTIWVYDATRRSSTRITSDGFALFPVWTPDGGRVTFSWSRAGIPSIWIRAEGGGEMEQLTHNQFPQYPGSWTRDGKFLALVETNPLTGSDILVLGIEEKRLTPFLVTKSAERWPEFSPDAQWLAYTSDESGTDEVYVRKFPAGDKVAMISNKGGVAPVWGPDGRELFYWNSDYTELMKVDVIPGQGLSVGLPSILLEVSASSTFPIRAYDIAPEGNRFLIPGRRPIVPREVFQLNFVQNWFEELKRLCPTGK
jgi:Tol biopolymer transport system component